MIVRGIGMGVGGFEGVDPLKQLEQALMYCQVLGFDEVEIDPTAFSLIINGELRRPQLADFLAVLHNFDLRYSMHGLMRLNLAYDPRHELCRRIMACQIEIARGMGAMRLVYHSGLQALDDAHHGVRRSLLTDEELIAGAQREVDAFVALAPLAADAGVVIGMENGDPHHWEYNVLAQYGHLPSDLPRHHARLRIGPIVRQLEAIDRPNVALTLDVGHLFIAARELGFDFLAEVREAAPWVKHIHAHDNFGLLDQGFDAEQERWPFGEADLHMPPGWGAIPWRDVCTCLPDYDGDVILEIKPGFWTYLDQALVAMREILLAVAV
ncbi:MAG TPA: sugar phosphate isomerase/epimerase [Anaerolineae bacterium]|nr:sugar phosphate isomerase/epimerase [Anaerolineae bacterium]HQH39103.1 sugar phosphate isomerase/epimerase [Anaerolineae bacterium]